MSRSPGHGFPDAITVTIIDDLNCRGAVPAFRQSIFEIILVWVCDRGRNGGRWQALDRRVSIRIVGACAQPVIHTEAGVIEIANEIGQRGTLASRWRNFPRPAVSDIIVPKV